MLSLFRNAVLYVRLATLRTLFAAYVRVCDRRRSLGLELVDLTFDGSGAQQFDALSTALKLLEESDPRRWRRLRRQVNRIVLIPPRGNLGEYWPSVNVIALSTQDIAQFSRIGAAMTLVHESVHALIRRKGLYSDQIKGRIERLCVKEEIAFGRRIAGAEGLCEAAERRLATRWWQNGESMTT